MSWPPVKTWTAVVVTVPDLNTEIRDRMTLLKTSIDDNGHLYDSTIIPVSANYAIAATDDLILCNGTFTVTLLTAVGRAGKSFKVKQVGTGVVTMATTSSQTIDGAAASVTQIFAGDSLTFESDGSNWQIV